MAPKKQGIVLQLQPETWGERFHRAYRTARRQHGLMYRGLADKVALIFPTSEQAILRLEDYDDIPPQARQRFVAYLSLVAMGFDPEEFGLNASNTALGGFDIAKLRATLSPGPVKGSRSKASNGKGVGNGRKSPCFSGANMLGMTG